MRKSSIINMFFILIFIGMFSASAFGGETGHFTNGGEGIKVATLPPPGLYYKMYNFLYTADKLMDKEGDKSNVDFEISSYVNVQRVLWVSDLKLLGADCAFNVLVPLVYTDMKVGESIDGNEFALGDIAAEVAMAWHGPSYDGVVAFAVFLPFGKYDKSNPIYPGRDMWTYMFTVGWTQYLDSEKTWSLSICPRYEIHSEKDELDIRLGNDFHFEWGIGKTLASVWDVGLTGYCHWQVTDDRGSDALWDKSAHDQIFAIGPEVTLAVPSIKAFFTLRSQWEFGGADRPEGNFTTLAFSKSF